MGGHTPAAYRRAVSVGHGWYGFALSPEAAAGCAEGLRQAASEVDRPTELGELEVSVTPRRAIEAESVAAFAEAGVERLVLNTIGAATPDAVEDRLGAAAALVA